MLSVKIHLKIVSRAMFPTDVQRSSFDHPDDVSEAEVIAAYQEDAEAKYIARADEIGPETSIFN